MKKLVLYLSIALMMCAAAFTQDAAAAPKAKAKKTAAASAPKAADPKHPDVPTLLARQLNKLQNHMAPAAEARPDDKFNFAPSNALIKGGEFTGVKTYA